MAEMRAFQIPGWQSAPVFNQVPVPTPGPGQVLLKVSAVGLCHTDIALPSYPADFASQLNWKVPFTLGHEISGTVAALGAGATGVEIGDAVVASAANPCGSCWYCLRGKDQNCVVTSGRGYGDDGGLAEYVIVTSPRQLVSIGDLDPVIAAPLADAGATAYHGVNRVLHKLTPDTTAVVIGTGGLGGYAVQFLHLLSGAHVIAVEPNEQRRELALKLGADEAIDGVDEGTVAAIKERTGGRGADVVLDFVGVDATISAGVQATARGGSYGVVGAAGGSLPSQQGWFHDLPRDGEVFTYQGSSVNELRGVISLAQRGLLQSPIVEFPFDQLEDAYAQFGAGTLTGRAVIRMPAGE
ncbi:propanol-preferring alcohol dehydrogenase [Leucobacter exalbidus]|uniref:alcohol dehydrogenase n=1 Tax=Leucobacter exalbidus TaxID=662960 RepID=A0A940T5Y6_9MICO|nr:alcohol dehydrogenase catalytic domain-containing protein [Leucobacter exalbidus]MBP1326446.1 propanol-preferring alcohol dehydrogenase [Leucobacter exalbidus]